MKMKSCKLSFTFGRYWKNRNVPTSGLSSLLLYRDRMPLRWDGCSSLWGEHSYSLLEFSLSLPSSIHPLSLPSKYIYFLNSIRKQLEKAMGSIEVIALKQVRDERRGNALSFCYHSNKRASSSSLTLEESSSFTGLVLVTPLDTPTLLPSVFLQGKRNSQVDLYKPALYQIRANNSRLSRRVVQVRGGRRKGRERRRRREGEGEEGQESELMQYSCTYYMLVLKALFLFCSRSRLSQNISILIFGNNF